MRTIYIDDDFKCHTVAEDTMTAVETDFFDGKCRAYVEGYRLVPLGETWVREDGESFTGELIAPWKSYDELDAVQREYERQLIKEYEANLAELDSALLDIQYNNLMEGL